MNKVNTKLHQILLLYKLLRLLRILVGKVPKDKYILVPKLTHKHTRYEISKSFSVTFITSDKLGYIIRWYNKRDHLNFTGTQFGIQLLKQAPNPRPLG